MNKRRVDTNVVKRFLPYLKEYPKELLGALISGIIGGTASVVMTYYTGKAIDSMIGKGRVDFESLLTVTSLLAGILLIAVITQWIVQILGNRISYYSVAKLRNEAFRHLNQLPLNFFDQNSHGNIMSRFTNDLDFVSEACVAIFNNLFSGMSVVLISLISMLWLSPTLTLVVLISTPLIFIVTWIVAKTSQKQFVAQQQLIGEISGFVSEVIGNQKIVKAFQYEKESQTQFDHMNQKLYSKGQKAQFSSSLTNPLSRFIDHLTYTSIGLVGGILFLQGNSALTIGIISSFTIYSSQFSKPFIDLSGITTQIQTALAGLSRIFSILDTPLEIPDLVTSHAMESVEGKIEFRHVYFSYTKERPLIQNFNLTVSPGETIAIVGKTGAGKSTLVNLLMRFYDVDRGTIAIDDLPINQYKKNSLRKSFGMVLQDTWLFDGTIRENLTFGNPSASEEDLIKGARSALVLSFIEKLPNGFDTVIGSQGTQISEGQRQLLTIARTMISDPPMLILDEATSSVDTLTENKIQTAFLKMMQGKTSFVIAHRLATIKNANKILVMDNGEIVAIGTHEELLSKKQGFYHTLYHAQFKHS